MTLAQKGKPPPITSSQAKREYLELIEGNFGSLPQTEFTKAFVRDYNVDEIGAARQEMFELCVLEIPGTPTGDLIVRKDRGSKNISEKLADDVYLLYPYMRYVEDIFTIKTRKVWKDRHTDIDGMSQATPLWIPPVTPATTSTRDNRRPVQRMEQLYSDNEFTVSALDTIKTLVIELRKERELLRNDIVDMKVELATIKVEVNHMKDHMSKSTEKITDNEKESKATYKKLANKCKEDRERGAVTSNLVDKNSDSISSVRQMYSSMNERINKMELHIRYSNIGSNTIPVRITNQPRPLPRPIQIGVYTARKEKVGPPNAAPDVASNTVPDCTAPDPAPDTTQRKVQDVAQDDAPDSDQGKIADTTPDTSQIMTGRAPPAVEPTQLPQAPARSNQAPLQEMSHDTDTVLEGYTRVKYSKPKYIAYYVGGVITKETDDLTKQCVSNYVTDKLGFVRSVRKLKEAGHTTSFKVVVYDSDSAIIDEGHFWPNGIVCRKWEI